MRAPALATLEAAARGILGRALTETELGLFDKYLKLLLKWQRSQRLVGSANPGWIVDNLLLDSLLFLRVLPASAVEVLDLGSGAGLPGIPVKIIRPEVRLTMLEARRKRASFLAAAVRELDLRDARVINARAEEVGGELTHRFDAVVMRCAGSPERILPLAETLLRHGGTAVIAGPPDPRQEPPMGRWITVPGAEGVRSRNLLVHRKA